MKLFPGMSVSDLAAAAIACVTPAGSWLAFWLDHRRRSRERRRKQLEQLEHLRVQLQHDIAPWAGNVWDEKSHSADWYNPSIGVRAFDWSFVERFNRVVMEGDHPAELTARLVRLEELARNFHDRVRGQFDFLRKAPADIALRWPKVVEASKAQGSPLSPEAMAGIEVLTTDDRRYLTDLYVLNKELHVAGIGGPGKSGLYAAWKSATDQLDVAQERLRAGANPWWYNLGHVLAGGLALTGLLFIGDFWWSVVDAKRQPFSTAAPAPVNSTTISTSLQADTMHAGRANSQPAQRTIATPTPEQKELWSLDHPARIGCFVSSTTEQDSLIVMNSGYPVREIKVDRLVFFDVKPYAQPGEARLVRYVVGDYYRDQLDGDYEGSQRPVFGLATSPGNMPLIHAISAGLQDSLTGRGFAWDGIEVGRAIRIVYWDMVWKRTEVHFWGADAAGQAPSHMKPIRRREWERLVAFADSVRKSGRTLMSGTTTRDADVQRVIRDCISAVMK